MPLQTVAKRIIIFNIMVISGKQKMFPKLFETNVLLLIKLYLMFIGDISRRWDEELKNEMVTVPEYFPHCAFSATAVCIPMQWVKTGPSDFSTTLADLYLEFEITFDYQIKFIQKLQPLPQLIRKNKQTNKRTTILNSSEKVYKNKIYDFLNV